MEAIYTFNNQQIEALASYLDIKKIGVQIKDNKLIVYIEYIDVSGILRQEKYYNQ